MVCSVLVLVCGGRWWAMMVDIDSEGARLTRLCVCALPSERIRWKQRIQDCWWRFFFMRIADLIGGLFCIRNCVSLHTSTLLSAVHSRSLYRYLFNGGGPVTPVPCAKVLGRSGCKTRDEEFPYHIHTRR